MTDLLIPYRMSADDTVTMALLLCIFLVAGSVIYLGAPLLRQIGRTPLFSFRKRDFTEIGVPSGTVALLLAQALISTALLVMGLSIRHEPGLAHLSWAPGWLLPVYILASALFYWLRWVLYKFIGWLFFTPSEVEKAIDGWGNFVCVSGLLFLIVVLIGIYYPIGFSTFAFLGILAVVIADILLFCWFKKLFYSNFYGGLLLFLYFCALEIIPIILMVFGIVSLNEYLLLNY